MAWKKEENLHQSHPYTYMYIYRSLCICHMKLVCLHQSWSQQSLQRFIIIITYCRYDSTKMYGFQHKNIWLLKLVPWKGISWSCNLNQYKINWKVASYVHTVASTHNVIYMYNISLKVVNLYYSHVAIAAWMYNDMVSLKVSSIKVYWYTKWHNINNFKVPSSQILSIWTSETEFSNYNLFHILNLYGLLCTLLHIWKW